MDRFEASYRSKEYYERPHKTFICLDCLYRHMYTYVDKERMLESYRHFEECPRCQGLSVCVDYMRAIFTLSYGASPKDLRDYERHLVREGIKYIEIATWERKQEQLLKDTGE